MIELARNARKLSQKDLMALLPEDYRPNISNIERGELAVTEIGLAHIAKALDFPTEFFYQDEIKTPLSNIYFRKRATLSVKSFNKIFADLKIILRSIDYILEEIELKEYPKYQFDLSKDWTPETVAIRLREIMQIHPGRPVKNIVTLIEEMGVIVFFYDSPDAKFDGLTAYTDNGIPVIFVNKNMPADRIKYTIVHELIHLVSHIPCNLEPWRDYEGEADSGTSEFYMPAKEFTYDARNLSYAKLGELKSYWGVSKAAIIRRAKDLSLINANTYKYLMIELGRKGERKNEAGYVEIDSPKILATSIDLLKSERGYTNEHFANKVHLQVMDYCRFFDPQSRPQVTLRAIRNIA